MRTSKHLLSSRSEGLRCFALHLEERKSSIFAKRFIHPFLAVVFAWICLAPQIARAGIITSFDTLPPFNGTYASGGVHALFNFLSSSGVIIRISDPRHSIPSPMTLCGDPPGSSPCGTPTIIGAMEIETFKSEVDFVIDGVDAMGNPVLASESFHGSAIEVMTKVTLISILGATRIFDTEILSLTIDGMAFGLPFTVREDPDRASTGQTTIEDLGGGLFRIDSFFDVFTELSVNGSPFVDSDTSGRVVLVTEPATLALCGAGLALLGLARRRGKFPPSQSRAICSEVPSLA